jgi:putative transposase
METCAVDERMRLVLAMERQDEPMAALCRRFGVSRRIGYKWLERYRKEGVAGLADRSRAPRHHPQAVSAAIAERCLAVRRAHPTWGPVKVQAFLQRRAPATRWPAASTIGGLFDREGLTVKRRLRRRRRVRRLRPAREPTTCGRSISRAGSSPATARVVSR